MATSQGMPIWYELVTPDPEGARDFYRAVAGWTIETPAPGAPMDYRMIQGPAGVLGGVLNLDEQMRSGGARPSWLLYIAADDVDATVTKARGLGAHVVVPPTDIPGAGRFSLLIDPQGAPFYVMRGEGAETSTVFGRGEIGRCGWNELATTDAEAALAFYGELFGWENRETMDMGPMGGYHFLDCGETRIGAVVRMPDAPPHWTLHFNVEDVDASAEAARAHGGAVTTGPMDVPGGERIVRGSDPQGAGFALVSRPPD